jgi:hypothetical protein
MIAQPGRNSGCRTILAASSILMGFSEACCRAGDRLDLEVEPVAQARLLPELQRASHNIKERLGASAGPADRRARTDLVWRRAAGAVRPNIHEVPP